MSGPQHGRTLRIDSDVLGQAQPWAVVHRGLEYPGEVVVAESVDPEWGQPLRGNVSFRVVLFTVPRRIPVGQIRDPRIAMAVPRSALGRTRQSINQEIQAIHESRERYVTRGDQESQALRSYMEKREAHNYAEGRIYTQGGQNLQAADIFLEESASFWMDNLVRAMYQAAYPRLPFDAGQLPSDITDSVIESTFKGVLQGDPSAAETARGFGPALGISKQEDPAVFDASDCVLVQSMEEELESREGEMPAQEMLVWLGYRHGINRALASLYLMAWVRHRQAEVRLALSHSIQLRAGGRLLSDRISWEMILEVEFRGPMADEFRDLRARPPLAWNTVLPYASLLVVGLHLSQDPDEAGAQEARLVEELGNMGRRLEASAEAIRELAPTLLGEVDTTLTELDRLRLLSSATGFRGFHAVAVDTFGGHSGLSRALDLYRRPDRLAELAPEITRERLYLDEMSFGRRHQELEVSRSSLVGRMGLDSLMGDPQLWQSVEEGCRQLRTEYGRAYLRHHAEYHEGAARLLSSLERLRPQIEALEWFNDVPGLGGPLGSDIPGRYNDLVSSLRTCGTPTDEIALEAAPACRGCELTLNEDLPRREAESVVRDTEITMRIYNRRLSSEGVRRVLAHPTKEQLDKFINLVQMSDPSALANVLDDEVVEFLSRFVQHDP